MKKTILLRVLIVISYVSWCWWGVLNYDVYRLFILLIPPIIGINLFSYFKKIKLQNTCITIFVIAWLALFTFESLQYFYFPDSIKQKISKTKFLFPPAGWIMFFEVGNQFGYREVYGIKGKQVQTIDPHDIFRTRTIMFDNIHRGVASSAAAPRNRAQFCKFLAYRFPYFDNFFVKLFYYPDIHKNRFERKEKVEYVCAQ